MELIKVDEIQMPIWARCPIANGDYSGLSDEDESTVLEWLHQLYEDHSHVTFEHTGDFSEFEPFPEFGLGCDCERVIIWAEKPSAVE